MSPAQLVDSAETTVVNGEFADQGADALRFVVSRLGVAGIRTFGLTGENREDLPERLGYRTRVDVLA